MVRKYYEISCDTCGSGDHDTVGGDALKKRARENGWIITKDNEHYCTKECYNEAH